MCFCICGTVLAVMFLLWYVVIIAEAMTKWEFVGRNGNNGT